MLTMRGVMALKIESPYGSDALPGVSDTILVENVSGGFDGVKMVEFPAVRPSIGSLQPKFAGALRSVSFDTYVKGSGTAGTAPRIGRIFQAAGCTETVVASTSVTYKFSSNYATDHKSLTVYYYLDGVRRVILGGIVTALSINWVGGDVIKMSVTIVGHDAGLTDTALITPTFETTPALSFIGATFSIAAYAAKIAKLSLDFGMAVSKPPDVNATDGYGQILITGRKPKGSFDPELVTVATHDFMGRFKAGTTGALLTGVIGSTVGNRVATTLNSVYYEAPSEGDREGKSVLNVPFGMDDGGTADNEMSLAFT